MLQKLISIYQDYFLRILHITLHQLIKLILKINFHFNFVYSTHKHIQIENELMILL